MSRFSRWLLPVLVEICAVGLVIAGLPPTLSFASQAEAKEAPTNPLPSSRVPDVQAEALKLYYEGKFDAAIEKYQQRLEEKPDSSEAYAGLTRIYLKQKNVQQASAIVSKGIQVADGPAVRVALGEVYFRQGKIPEAEREWANVINSGHPEARAYLGLSRVDESLSLYKKSKTMIEKAHQLDPNDPEIQLEWTGTLSRSERIRNLEEYLADVKNDDAATREHYRHYLEYLKARQQGPPRNCKLLGNATSTETRLVPLLRDARHMQGLGLTVTVNGAKANLLLDTGAAGILIDRGFAEKSGVQKIADTSIRGFGDHGENAGWVGSANSIKIGELEFQNCPVRVVEKRSVVDQQGLIGADVFAHFLVDINFPDRKLRLSELPKRPGEISHSIELKSEDDDFGSEPAANHDSETSSKSPPTSEVGPFDAYVSPDMKSYSKIFRFGHKLLIPTRIGDAPPKLFLIDSGAFTNFIDPAAAREVTKVHGDSEMTVKGVSGWVRNVYSADKTVLAFGHLRQENQDMVSFDMTSLSNGTGTQVSGTLGFATLVLLDLKIDYRDGLVDFSYDGNRFH